MARRLNPEETAAFAEKLTHAEERPTDKFTLQDLGDRREAILSMSPELRAFFSKDATQGVSES